MPFVPCKSRRIQLSYVSKLSKVNITYTACISGKINGETFVWSSYHGGNLLRLSPTKEKIAIFEETLKRIRITKAASNLVEIEFTIHFGKQREQRSCTVLYRRAELLTRKRPEYAEEVMTDGVRCSSLSMRTSASQSN